MENKDIDWKEVQEEDYRLDMLEQKYDDMLEECEGSVEDGLDPAFSSWADYYHYMFGF